MSSIAILINEVVSLIRMVGIKAVFFDIDGTLYDSRLLAERSRKNAVRAMIEAGLPAEEEEAMSKLASIVKKHGANYDNHYDKLLEEYGVKKSRRIVAAGVVAYHNTKTAYLVPYRETIPALLDIRDIGLKLGVISNGLSVKQWEKIIRLGLQHFFHTVVISQEVRVEKPDPLIFEKAAIAANAKPGECVIVGDRLDRDICGGNEAGFVTVQVVREGSNIKPSKKMEEPDYIISDFTSLPELVLL